MSNCRTGCPTPGEHETWGECVRASSIQFGPVDVDGSVKRWDSDLAAYRAVRRQGMTPPSTKRSAVEETKRAVGA